MAAILIALVGVAAYANTAVADSDEYVYKQSFIPTE
jgi:hypothetical protein